MNKKGFTLLELLAVIIILGILMLIAIPSVTTYIDKSRKQSYISTAFEIIKGASTYVNSGELIINDTDTTYYLPLSLIPLENGNMRSPYGDIEEAYVLITYDGTDYNYYFTGRDSSKLGVVPPIKYNELTIYDIEGNIEEIDKSIKMDGTHFSCIFDNNGVCNEYVKPLEKDPNKIYWALQDTDSDDINDLLIISDTEVSGNHFGSIDKEDHFSDTVQVPWINTSSSTSANNLSNKVNTIRIEGDVLPIYTAYWFSGVGYNADHFSANLNSLDFSNVIDASYMLNCVGYNSNDWDIGNLSSWNTSNVINMSYMFSGAGRNSTIFNLDLSGWNVSNVTNMKWMFFYAGMYASSWTIGNLKDWNTSNVTDMSRMFDSVAYKVTGTVDLSYVAKWDVSKVTSMEYMFDNVGNKANTFTLGDLKNWNVSNVTKMHAMFSGAGMYASSWTIGNLSTWNVSNVIEMSSMFSFTGTYDKNWSIGDLKNWNTSKVTKMHMMFTSAGNKATTWSVGDISKWNVTNVSDFMQMFASAGSESRTFRLDISKWNLSGASSLSNMFDNTGKSASTWSIKIPKTNGKNINNTSSKIYGWSTSVSASPPSGKSFTVSSN